MQEEKEIDEMLILVEMVNCSLGIAIQSLYKLQYSIGNALCPLLFCCVGP